MSNNLHQAGTKFLRLLARHGDAIMDAYISGSLGDHQVEAKVQDKLVKAGVLYRPEPGADLHLRHAVRSLLEEALKDERNRQIDANAGSAIAAFKTLAQHYTEARHQGDIAVADAHYRDLSEHVYAFSEGLQHSIRVMWSRINNEFGYVSSINAKIRENELAQSQVSELLAGLEMISFEELADIAGDIRELRRLLVANLQQNISQCIQELSVVQGRLLQLLGRFRQIHGRAKLLKGWLLYTEQHPDYEVGNHVSHKQIPALFNQADPAIAAASVDIHNSAHESTLVELVAHIKANRLARFTQAAPQHSDSVILQDNPDYELDEHPIKAAVSEYFVHVIDNFEPGTASLSALDYLQQQQLEYDAESWLYQVIGGYEGLPQEQKAYFELDPETETRAPFANVVIRDVSVGLR
ncbi:phosphoenolpyruvate carboxylase [Corallincola spongiicola]|uniref:Phosphoenolpyruvate carboxylase n=1 Tax=Corallincola spongiicola TaxID=2520508 RepID=A0ABY1WSZ0_9GAMM|nr:phosphoenolpyruvate carboxylase [Corallincola spongiicola]TAA47863.1 phosphoenolpyruvate carboxylase [Corallincola spongiicola]